LTVLVQHSHGVNSPMTPGRDAQALDAAIRAQQDGRQVTAVGIREHARFVVVEREEERGVMIGRRRIVERAVHRIEQAREIVRRLCVERAQIGLQAGHQQRR
jgi:hypothetical protein